MAPYEWFVWVFEEWWILLYYSYRSTGHYDRYGDLFYHLSKGPYPSQSSQDARNHLYTLQSSIQDRCGNDLYDKQQWILIITKTLFISLAVHIILQQPTII